MKHIIKLLLVTILFISCNSEPKYIYEDVKETVIVVDKKEAIETDHVYTENIFGSGDSMFKKVPETKTVYYIIFDNGDVDKVSIKLYYKYKIGDSYIISKKVKKANPKHQKQ